MTALRCATGAHADAATTNSEIILHEESDLAMLFRTPALDVKSLGIQFLHPDAANRIGDVRH
jgi:hypothetical protein